jgi:hypothetical protein
MPLDALWGMRLAKDSAKSVSKIPKKRQQGFAAFLAAIPQPPAIQSGMRSRLANVRVRARKPDSALRMIKDTLNIRTKRTSGFPRARRAKPWEGDCNGSGK